MTSKKGEAPTAGTVDASRSQSPIQDEQPQAVPGGLRLRRPTLYPAELRVQRVADANVAPSSDSPNASAKVLAAWFDQETKAGGMLERIDPLTAYALGWHVSQVVMATEPPTAAAELVAAEERARAKSGKELARLIVDAGLVRLRTERGATTSPAHFALLPLGLWHELKQLAGDVLGILVDVEGPRGGAR